MNISDKRRIWTWNTSSKHNGINMRLFSRSLDENNRLGVQRPQCSHSPTDAGDLRLHVSGYNIVPGGN